MAEGRKWFVISALPDAIPGYSALEEGDSRTIAPGTHPMQLPSARHVRGLSAGELGKERTLPTKYKDFCIITTLAQNLGRGLELCLPISFWPWPMTDQHTEASPYPTKLA